MHHLARPLACFDIESTGTNTATDRIIELAILRIEPGGGRKEFCSRFNPGRPIPAEASAVHGLSDADVANAPRFEEKIEEFWPLIFDADLAGFNLINFDVPILWEEMFRAGHEWDLRGIQILDAGNIFKKKEERSLSAAVQFYCDREHSDAHSAMADVQATYDVLLAQLDRYPDLGKMSVQDLGQFCRFDDRVDLAGKIHRDKEGQPIYAIGKSKGVRVVDDLSFAYWMLTKDFPAETKLQLQRIIDGEQERYRKEQENDDVPFQ